mgnify:CR=1 FL=1
MACFIVLFAGLMLVGWNITSCSDDRKARVTTLEVREFVQEGPGRRCDIDVMAGLTPLASINDGTETVMVYKRVQWWDGQCGNGALVIVDREVLASWQGEHRKEEARRTWQKDLYSTLKTQVKE